jgi:uncharacterized small protein (DUF1192 family)
MESGNFTNKRKRGIVLTAQGAQKLRDAIAHVENEENFGQKLTIAGLGFRTCLTPDTVAKVLDAEQGVDRRTLDRFFRLLNLELSESDSCRPDRSQSLQQQGISLQKIFSTSQVQTDRGVHNRQSENPMSTSEIKARLAILETEVARIKQQLPELNDVENS